MKILYDPQIFTWQKYGGISRYFHEITQNIIEIEGVSCDLSLLISNNHYISEKKLTKHIELFKKTDFRGKLRLFDYINKSNTFLELKRQNFDIFHPTYYDPYFLKHLGNKPFVLTVYDMIHEKFGSIFPITDKTTERKKLLVKKAAKIIAISQSTKNDLIQIFDTDESKIEVIHLGNSIFPKENINLNLEIPEKYLLFVGNRNNYKNFNLFIKGVSSLLKSDNDLFVVCAGGGTFTNSELKLLSELGILKQVFQYNSDDETLAFFYRNALTFVFPSLYEGFGIPILESFSCGCPLVCSGISSLPEIAGEAACYFDPYSEESIRNTISTIINDANLRKDLVNKGYGQLNNFSWKKTTEETRKLYEGILK
ncbi:glycosyltransferase family 4 protein [Thiothrix subterranea]|uniref:Glycosyltransferase family 1 protein n=1 Tax=Thiothrix subterranea TaxID=2735563 RepID=A0ABU0Y423_9GAMM|nr:glycosyltransferase family 1 protein [Thiothrix subterranea]MDQ5767543.1 glycosyltransferase family 1 protein [Thiothrix subterranea]